MVDHLDERLFQVLLTQWAPRWPMTGPLNLRRPEDLSGYGKDFLLHGYRVYLFGSRLLSEGQKETLR